MSNGALANGEELAVMAPSWKQGAPRLKLGLEEAGKGETPAI